MSKNIERAKILIETVRNFLKDNEKNFPYNRSEKGVVQVVNSDNTVNVKVLGEIYENIRVRTGLEVAESDIVWVMFPKNSSKDMFIDDLINKTTI